METAFLLSEIYCILLFSEGGVESIAPVSQLEFDTVSD